MPLMKLPVDFMASTRSLLKEDAELFFAALSGEPTVSIRLNPLKKARNPLKPGGALQQVPWSRWGYYLAERPAFTFDPLFHAGYYYVQEASSMFVEHVVRELVPGPVTCLDLCAAPGGKSLSLLSALPPGSLVVSNEVVRPRARVLSETVIKFGNSNVVVTNNGASDFGELSHFFDVVLVDAPCSGEGMFRKDAVAVEEWSAGNVTMCAARQENILHEVWPSLKPGGWLIYSTCTYNITENEEIMLSFARSNGAGFVVVRTDPDWGTSPPFGEGVQGYRFFPHRVKGEGLSLFILRKPEERDVPSAPVTVPARKNAGKKATPLLRDPSAHGHYLRRPDAFRFVERGVKIIALPALHADAMLVLEGRLNSMNMGIEVGGVKGKDFIPSHALAMSDELNRDAFYNFPVTYDQAIAYLRKEALVLPPAVPKGVILLTYENEPIGFVKNLGSRANNLYPSEWRIRSGYLPENVPRIFSTDT